MLDKATASNPDATALNGRRVLLTLVLFFGSIFAVNGYFIYKALGTYSGEIGKEPFSQGLAYNTRIAAAERQSQLKWSDKVDVGADGKVALSITDSGGLFIDGLNVEGELGRPSTASDDRHLLFKSDSRGHYVAETANLPAGAWIVSIEARKPQEAGQPIYQSRRRVWLNP